MQAECPVRASDVAYREIDGEMVLVSASTGRIYSLTAVGGFVWERADGTRDLSSIAEEMCGRYDVERELAIADTAKFVDELRGEGLLVSSELGAVQA